MMFYFLFFRINIKKKIYSILYIPKDAVKENRKFLY